MEGLYVYNISKARRHVLCVAHMECVILHKARHTLKHPCPEYFKYMYATYLLTLLLAITIHSHDLNAWYDFTYESHERMLSTHNH